MFDFNSLVALVLLVGAAGYGFHLLRRRSVQDVYLAMLESSQSEAPTIARTESEATGSVRVRLGAAPSKNQFTYVEIFGIALGVGVVLGGRIFWGPAQTSTYFICGVAGFAGGYLITRLFTRPDPRQELRELEFYLPLVMERIVMAVQSGLDVIPALSAIVSLEKEAVAQRRGKLDPITRLFADVLVHAEAGSRFEEALQSAVKGNPSRAVVHAFIHLAIAYKEGGELVAPLKELSDSTQAMYQDSIEEDVAKIPVKATVPLLLLFAGLLICFITPPLVQVSGLSMRVKSNIAQQK